jgi:hypothetical protein
MQHGADTTLCSSALQGTLTVVNILANTYFFYCNPMYTHLNALDSMDGQ